MSSDWPWASPVATPRLTVCRSTRMRIGARIASKRAPQSTSGTYTSSAPRWPGETDIRISPTDSVELWWYATSGRYAPAHVARTTRKIESARRK